jgi:hypothetical protein
MWGFPPDPGKQNSGEPAPAVLKGRICERPSTFGESKTLPSIAGYRTCLWVSFAGNFGFFTPEELT